MGVSLFVDRPEATKDVLPFATGLIGFLGGLVTAMFRQIGDLKAAISAENDSQVRDTDAQSSNIP